MEFCKDCEVHANALIDKYSKQKKEQAELHQKFSKELDEAKINLKEANKNVEFYKSKCEILAKEYEELKVLEKRARSSAPRSTAMSQDALEVANKRIDELVSVVQKMEKRGKCVKKAALMGGASAIIASTIVAAGTSVSRTITGFFAAFGAGTLAVVPFLNGRKKKEETISRSESDTDTQVASASTSTSGTTKSKKKS